MMWSLHCGRVTAWICGLAGAPLTLEEWQHYLPERSYAPTCH